jgi:hypothetical protein
MEFSWIFGFCGGKPFFNLRLRGGARLIVLVQVHERESQPGAVTQDPGSVLMLPRE